MKKHKIQENHKPPQTINYEDFSLKQRSSWTLLTNQINYQQEIHSLNDIIVVLRMNIIKIFRNVFPNFTSTPG